MTRYVVIGAGAVGVSLTAELRGAGRQVVLVGGARQLELARTGRLHYHRPWGETTLDVPAVAGPSELSLTVDDILVLATKAQHADQALSDWAAHTIDDGRPVGQVLPLLTVQNGLAAELSALRRFATVVGSVLWSEATYLTDGEVSVPTAPSPGAFWLGSCPDGPATAAARRIADDLSHAGFDVQIVDDLSRWKAGKLIASTAYVLDALYPPSPVRDRAARLARAEALDLLTAAAIDPVDLWSDRAPHIERLVTHAIEGRERKGSSTYQSLARGKQLETDFLNGEITLIARQLGRRAPVNTALQTRANLAGATAVEPGSLPISDLTGLLAASVLIDAESLKAELAGPVAPALLDVRWRLGDPDGEKHYLEAHLPTAVYVDLDSELAAAPTAEGGRHPLPDRTRLQESARRWGLRDGHPVVVYDDNAAQSAARAWWLLRWAGVKDVRILDGGINAWRAAGGLVDAGAHLPLPGDITLSEGHLPVLDTESTAALPGYGVLIDARAGARYRGEVEPVDPRAGHIPGALSMPSADNLGPDGRFLPVEQLRDLFTAAGLTVGAGDDDVTVGVYCGSGVTAAHQLVALQLAGIDGALYPGSWSAWSADPTRPIATGRP